MYNVGNSLMTPVSMSSYSLICLFNVGITYLYVIVTYYPSK